MQLEIFDVARQLKLSAAEAQQILKRMVFNIVARNHDDHAKNFAFILKNNTWSLSPAYDLAYSYKPGSQWVNSHWMSLNGKRDGFTRSDFYSLEKLSPLFSKNKIDKVIDETIEHVSTRVIFVTNVEVNGVVCPLTISIPVAVQALYDPIKRCVFTSKTFEKNTQHWQTRYKCSTYFF